MGVNEQVDLWLADTVSPELLHTPLPEEIAGEVVERLKQEADRQWFISPNRSLELATRIVSIGQARADVRQIALGLMAQGDTLKFLGRLEEAWEMLEQAGRMFEAVDDEVGWARTRIGRLHLGLKLSRVADAIADVDRARTIFMNHNERERLIRLDNNTAYVYTLLGKQHEALHLYRDALETAEALGDAGQQHLGLLHMNIGFVHEALGDFPLALTEYEKARELFHARNETRNIVNIELNLAYIAQIQGHYRYALRLLYDMLDRGLEEFPLEDRAVKQDLTECYLYLNRFSEARELARQVVSEYKDFHATYDMARTLLHLATAEAELGDFPAADSALDEATPIFVSLEAVTWSMLARLRRGQVALKQGNRELALQEALTAAIHFQQQGQQFNYAMASLLIGQISLADMDLNSAWLRANQALQIAKRYNVPSLRYAAYLLLGQTAIAQSHTSQAIRYYQAAAAIIDRVQRGLTITLRSGFLENKHEAGRELVTQYLNIDKPECAFEALERTKSQVLLSYLGDREQFHWISDDPKSQALLDELERLRTEHQWFYRLVQEPPRNPELHVTFNLEKALEEVQKRERRIRAITEQLYLYSRGSEGPSSVLIKSVHEIQQALEESTVLIEYYNDGRNIWAFAVDRHSTVVHRLPVTPEELDRLIRQLQVNITTALQFDSQGAIAHKLGSVGQRILQRLYSLLIESLELKPHIYSRVAIIPYGSLHYLPFNLLHDGSAYLIENFEVVTLPAAGLITRPGPQQAPHALILSNSREGKLPQTGIEAELVHRLFGGTLAMEDSASRAALRMPPSQILHIAAHGQHRLDQPDLSYIELADGQVYADDLLQQDLSYELVTLSGCETGRAHVAAGDELIGLGRGLLYAGAGALILSLWQVADASTVSLMEQLYKALKAGKSKAAALREAQVSFLAYDRGIHPAFWGAFQLVGDASPLSTFH